MAEPLFVDITTLAQQRGNDLVNQGKRLFNSIGTGATQVSQALFPKQPQQYVPINDPKAQMTRAVPLPNIDPTGMVGNTAKVGTAVAKKAAEPIFKGFTDLSTKLLKDLEGKGTIAKQYLLDATNRPELKQPEKDLFRRLLNDEGDKIDVPTFANKVKSELLPLSESARAYDYEGFTLPEELRGPVADYYTKVHGSPIKTSAGQKHPGLGNPDNYFAHTRIEDLPDNASRRVIEIQSDLFQKGRLEREFDVDATAIEMQKRVDKDKALLESNLPEWRKENIRKSLSYAEKELESIRAGSSAKQLERSKLEPYRNTWHERIIREEVKQAAKDGKTKLQFPTGETAMKIEGLGANSDNWVSITNGGRINNFDQLKVGEEVGRAGEQEAWIITDVLGDGKFKAVPKRYTEDPKFLAMSKADQDEWMRDNIALETFDISGKVDTENPIYKFYEKTVQKYLTNKYGGKVITDPQGVKWVEIDVKPEFKGMPIEAFGAALFPIAGSTGMSNNQERRFQSTPVDRTSLFINKQ